MKKIIFTAAMAMTIGHLCAQSLKNWVVQDGGDEKKAYLLKQVSLYGDDLDKVESLSVGGIQAEITQKTKAMLAFKVPETFKFTAARECEVVANPGKKGVALFKMVVYPFYFYPDVILGAQSKSNRSIVFLDLNSGKVLSSDEWNDPLAGPETQTASNALNKAVVTSAKEYESVAPYFYLMSSVREQGLAFVSPSNSKRMLGNIQGSDNKPIISGDTWGTPIIGFRQLDYDKSSKNEKAYVDSVGMGNLRTLSLKTILTRAAFGNLPFTVDESKQTNFKAGQVLLINYISYETGGFKDLTAAGVKRMGYIHVKDISDVDATTGKPTVDSRMTMDVYWSRELK